MKKALVWIDQRKALVISEDNRERIIEVPSEVEEVQVHGGYGADQKFLPQDAVSETKLTARKTQQLSTYYKEVMDTLPPLRKLYIMGPGETRKLFSKEVVNALRLADNQVVVEASDKLTDNQLRAKARELLN